MTLEEMTIKDLLVLHNELSEKAAHLKSFKTKGDLIRRIKALQNQSAKTADANQTASVFVAKTPRGAVGRLARRILLDPSGTPYEDIALFVNQFVPGAKATPQSVAWYASRMRREGTEVPKRAPLGSVCVWIEDPSTADRWLDDCGIEKAR